MMEIRYLLGNIHCLPLSHIGKIYICLQETNQSIKEFSIVYMMNPNLSMNKVFRDQVKGFTITAFSASTMKQISKIRLKPNTRVLALVLFIENRKKVKRICLEC